MLEVALRVQASPLGLDLIAGRSGDPDLKVQDFGRLQPGIADVIGVADPGHGFAADGAAMLDKREDIRQDLAGMGFVGQAVDHGHAGVRRKALHNGLLEGPDHHQIAHPRDHLGSIFDGFAAAKLSVAGVEIDCCPAELMHAGFKGEPGAGRGLLEDHHQRAVQ